MPAIGDFQRFNGFVQEFGDVELLDVQTGGSSFHTAQIQQEGNKIAQALRLGKNALKIGWRGFSDPISHVLDHRLQCRHRRAQFVANVGNHVQTHFVGML